MIRNVLLLAVMALALMVYSHALACDTCGCGKTSGAAGGSEGHGHSHGDGHSHGEGDGHSHGEGEGHSHGAEGHDKMMPDYSNAQHMDMSVMEWNEPLYVAVMQGTLSDDVHALFGSMMEAVQAQGLWTEETHVGAVVPNALTEEDMAKIQFWPGVSISADTSVAAPLVKHTVQPARYLVVIHMGPYEKLSDTWMATFEYIESNGIELDSSAACLEHYVNDPETTPEAELITEILFPLADGALPDGI